MLRSSSRRGRQRGFSLIVVFLLIIVMVGVSSAVMLSAQGDLQVSGHDREGAAALYAAEAGVAWAQWFLSRYANPGQKWDTVIHSPDPAVQAAYCAAPGGNLGAPHPWTALPPAVAPAAASTPGQQAAPLPGTAVLYDDVRGVTYQWCIHNNALDPNYGMGAIPLASADTSDGDNIVTIESYGWYGRGTLAAASASAHLTVDVANFNSTTNIAADYQQSGGNATKQARGETFNYTATASKTF